MTQAKDKRIEEGQELLRAREDALQLYMATPVSDLNFERRTNEAVSEPLYVAPEGTPHHEAYVEGWQSCLVRLKALAQSLGGPND